MSVCYKLSNTQLIKLERFKETNPKYSNNSCVIFVCKYDCRHQHFHYKINIIISTPSSSSMFFNLIFLWFLNCHFPSFLIIFFPSHSFPSPSPSLKPLYRSTKNVSFLKIEEICFLLPKGLILIDVRLNTSGQTRRMDVLSLRCLFVIRSLSNARCRAQ